MIYACPYCLAQSPYPYAIDCGNCNIQMRPLWQVQQRCREVDNRNTRPRRELSDRIGRWLDRMHDAEAAPWGYGPWSHR